MCIGQEYNEGTLLQDTRIINYPGAFINTLMRVREREQGRERDFIGRTILARSAQAGLYCQLMANLI